MSRRLDPTTIETCTIHLHKWKPFTPPTSDTSNTTPKPIINHHSSSIGGPYSKRPCRSDRTTSSFSIESILDMSKLTLFDKRSWFARKRRRRYNNASRSVSGRSCSDRMRSRSVNGTCSDLPMATDSSGELFGETNWASDVSERNNNNNGNGNGNNVKRREKEESVSVGGNEKGNNNGEGNESGYGSEPGYRGDAESGYGDEFDEEEDESKGLFWGDEFRGSGSQLEMVGENSMQKTHHRGRRKKQDVRMVDAPR